MLSVIMRNVCIVGCMGLPKYIDESSGEEVVCLVPHDHVTGKVSMGLYSSTTQFLSKTHSCSFEEVVMEIIV